MGMAVCALPVAALQGLSASHTLAAQQVAYGPTGVPEVLGRLLFSDPPPSVGSGLGDASRSDSCDKHESSYPVGSATRRRIRRLLGSVCSLQALRSVLK